MAIGKVGRFEILHRTVHSELTYIQVVGSWVNRDGAEALLEGWFLETYPHVEGFLCDWTKGMMLARNWGEEVVGTAWVWENPDTEHDGILK